jgi:hypothetical protein
MSSKLSRWPSVSFVSLLESTWSSKSKEMVLTLRPRVNESAPLNVNRTVTAPTRNYIKSFKF